MNNFFSYNGVVTLSTRVNGKTINKTHYNSGSTTLFEAYARALAGQNISSFLPKSIDMKKPDNSSILRSAVDVLAAYKPMNSDGANYGVPYVRLSAVLSKNAFVSGVSGIPENTAITLILNSMSGASLATVESAEILEDIKSLATGVQMILSWDLYVTNPAPTTA